MLENKKATMILSLIIAVILWLYVIGEVNPLTKTTIKDIPVQLLNAENLTSRDLAMLEESFTVSLTIQGQRSDIVELDKSEIIVTADLFGYNKGENYIPVNVTVPDKITLVEKNPPSILVHIEEMVSVYKPISLVYSAAFEDGAEAGNVIIQPEEIEVKGAKSAVERVASIKALIDTSQITGDVAELTPQLTPMDSKGQTVSGVTLSATTANVSLRKCYTKNVSLKVETTGEVASPYELDSISIPKKIKIRGPKDKIDEITTVEAKPVDLSKVTASGTIPLQLDLPKDVELANASSDTGVVVTLKGLVSKSFEIESGNIAIEGLAEGLYAYINTASISVTVTGAEDIMEGFDNSDIVLYVDASQLAEGSSILPVGVRHEKAFKSVQLSPEEVHITVTAS
ncbi:MAG: hypothetical protein K6F52_04910 [Clostridia bacterium]|nr:hypothetical protein [Clostridia bacterium]